MLIILHEPESEILHPNFHMNEVQCWMAAFMLPQMVALCDEL